MKLTVAVLLATAGIVAAQPHRHHHRHLAKKDVASVNEVVNVPGPTVVVYEFNGHTITQEEVEEGIRNGTLVMAQGGLSSAAPSYSKAAPTQSYQPAPQSSSQGSSAAAAPTSAQQQPSQSHAAPPSAAESSPAAATSAEAAATSAPAASKSNGSKHGSSGKGADVDFPDGELDCSTFPSDYGAVPVEWLGLGGWTGVQQPGEGSGKKGLANILTVTKAQCTGEGCCTEGSYCSYACPAGYQKSQWPETQGATGQSVGGILCKNGKLHLTNPSLSKSLCMSGTGAVKVKIENKMKHNAAVCRTDYPGTESETIPLDTQPGQTHDLTCPEADNYYKWLGKSTSAQYYANPKGVSVEDACQWGSSDKPWGNYAPLNFGVGYSGGNAWLSIFQNAPTTNEKLDYSVEIVGDHVIGRCKYQNGQYCTGDNYENCNSNGCTVSVAKGTATYVLS